MPLRTNREIELIGYPSGYEGIVAAAKQAREERLSRRRSGLPDKPLKLRKEKSLPDDFGCHEMPSEEEIASRTAEVQAKWDARERKKRAGALAPIEADVTMSHMAEDDRLASSRRVGRRIGAD